MINIKVPATTANIGPGYDSLGIALNLYNKFSFQETPRGLEIIGGLDGEKDADNLVYTSMLKTFEHVGYKHKGIRINIETNIPVSRGLGSSSTCIVAGVMAANEIAGKPLSLDDVLTVATEIEGHPDNIAPALFGGLVASLMEEDRIYYNNIQIGEGLKLYAIVPNFTVSTKDAREVLPENISHKAASENVARVSLVIAALSSGRFDLLKPGLKDNLHQPYRSKLIKGFDQVIDKCYEFKAYGAYLSGAGPTIMALVDESNNDFKEEMEYYLKSKGYDWKIIELQIDLDGAVKI